MAKGPKLTKLRSVLKKLNSFSSRSSPTSGRKSTAVSPTVISSSANASSDDEISNSRNCQSFGDVGLLPVYVGKSRRRYTVGPEVTRHPLFQELVERSGGYNDGLSGSVHVAACEVVLFEHMLWMLENADEESMDGQLADFYAYL
ncbi:hypothetical protein SAY86_009207 [Trapa natans]|uniref:Uncharacterized protein n=1 Tax=Trapa natans TaxID=22666 RepID=A0AAN7QQ05_TRANT|nr:hypothetical protein SAY86_009207 [Trapa natans]